MPDEREQPSPGQSEQAEVAPVEPELFDDITAELVPEELVFEPLGRKNPYRNMISAPFGQDLEKNKAAIESLSTEVESAQSVNKLLDYFEYLTSYQAIVKPYTEDYYYYRVPTQNFRDTRALSTLALRRIAEMAEAEGISSKDVITALVNRSFRDLTGNERAEKVLRDRFIGTLSVAIRELGSPGMRVAGRTELQAAAEALHQDEGRPMSYGDQMIVHYFERRGTVGFSYKDLEAVQPDSAIAVEYVINNLDQVDRESLSAKQANYYLTLSLNMMVDSIRMCKTRHGIHNAEVIQDQLERRWKQTGSHTGFADIIAAANMIRSQLSQPQIRGRATDMVTMVSDAANTIMDLLVNYGSNSLSDEQRVALIGYGHLIGDVFTIGSYLRDKDYADKPIDEYIAAQRHSQSAPAFDKAADETYHDLKGQFGSVVYWRRQRPGYGLIS